MRNVIDDNTARGGRVSSTLRGRETTRRSSSPDCVRRVGTHARRTFHFLTPSSSSSSSLLMMMMMMTMMEEEEEDISVSSATLLLQPCTTSMNEILARLSLWVIAEFIIFFPELRDNRIVNNGINFSHKNPIIESMYIPFRYIKLSFVLDQYYKILVGHVLITFLFKLMRSKIQNWKNAFKIILWNMRTLKIVFWLGEYGNSIFFTFHFSKKKHLDQKTRKI